MTDFDYLRVHALVWAQNEPAEVAEAYADWFQTFWADSYEYASHTADVSVARLRELRAEWEKAL